MKTLKVEKEDSYYITLPEEILEYLNIKEGDTVTMTTEDNCLVLHKNEDVEIDLELFSKDQLIKMIQAMNSANITFNEFIHDCLDYMIAIGNAFEDSKEILKKKS